MTNKLNECTKRKTKKKGTSNQFEQDNTSESKLKDVANNPKLNPWTRLHDPSGPSCESKRGGPSLDKRTISIIGLCKR